MAVTDQLYRGRLSYTIDDKGLIEVFFSLDNPERKKVFLASAHCVQLNIVTQVLFEILNDSRFKKHAGIIDEEI